MKNYPTLVAIVCLLALSPFVRSQYALTPVPPPPSFTFNDLWHLTVLRYAADNHQHFYLTLRVFDQNHTLKIKSNTATVSLSPGSHYFNLANISLLQPFATSYYDAAMLQQCVASGGTFPPGTYHMAYTLYGKAADGEFAPLCESTSEASVEALWPPMLLSPPDGDSIDTQYPLLTWTPAFSGNYGAQVTYTLNLVELFPGQDTYQAIQTNPLYFTQTNIPVTILPYPAGAQVLDTSKVYTWQVHAYVQGNPLGSSEVWTFTFKRTPPTNNIPLPKHYFKPSEKLNPDFLVLSGKFLPISIEERYFPTDQKGFRFRILNHKKEVLGTDGEFESVINTGFNKYLIPVCSSEGKISLPKGAYYIEIFLEKKVRLYLAFEIKETRCNE